MEHRILVPIFMFACATYVVKLLVDARMRWLLWRLGSSDELLRELLAAEERRRKLASFTAGIVLLSIAGGFGLIQAFGWNDINAGVVAVLTAATGAGNLLSYLLSRRLAP